MPDKPSKNRVVRSPFNDILTANPNHFIKSEPRPKDAVFIEKLEVKPNDQRRIPLGSFTEEKPPKGFLVEINPDPTPADSIITEVTTLGSHGRCTLYLHVANYGIKPVRVEVWLL